MALIRLQDKVPNIYVDESRDFQLLCRLYDVLINGVKYDIDGVERLISTADCKSTVLQLLQTKLGFFTSKNFTDTALRYILLSFPELVKKKGTKLAIEQAVCMYLKINGLETKTQIDIIENEPTAAQKLEFGNHITDHCVIIGLNSQSRDITALKEVLKYIIPFGYNLFFYFFTGQYSANDYTHTETVEFMYISNDVNDLAGSKSNIVKNPDGTYKDWDDTKKWYTKDFEDRYIAGHNTMEVRRESYTDPVTKKTTTRDTAKEQLSDITIMTED